MQDIVAALVAYLQADSGVSALVGVRVWGGELPDAEVEHMPRPNIVLRRAGGPAVFRSHRLIDQRVDVFSYGDGAQQADEVDRAAAEALMAIRRDEYTSTVLHSAAYGGSIGLRDPDAGWPYTVRTAIIRVGETAA